MRIETLKNPGAYSGSQSLRAKVASAISFAEVISRGRETPAPTAVNLAAFLADAASKCPGYEAPTPVLPDTQVIVEDAVPVTVPINGTSVEITPTVADGELTAITTDAAVVLDGDTPTVSVNGTSVAVTITVAGSLISEIEVPGALIADEQVLTIGGNTYTFTVVDGEVTDIVVAPV